MKTSKNLSQEDPICTLCGRQIPPDARQSRHHLVPKLKGGKHGAQVLLHQICHNEVHARITETDLAREFNTVEKLRAHPNLQSFLKFIQRKPPGFHSRTLGNPRRVR
ncbi:MAG: HNH endonuclease [Pseudomonadota bacterium]